MTTAHVAANAGIHQHATIHTSMIQTLVSVPVSHTIVQHISTLMLKPAAVVVMRLQPAHGINSSMKHRVNANARGSITATQEHITIMIHVNASVVTLQHAMHHLSMIQMYVAVSVNLMHAIQVNTLTMRVAVVSVQSTRHVQTISTSIEHLASVSVQR